MLLRRRRGIYFNQAKKNDFIRPLLMQKQG